MDSVKVHARPNNGSALGFWGECYTDFTQGVVMIRLGNQVRLNQDDVERLSKLTGADPRGIKTVDGLNSFIDQHNVYDESTPESKLLGMLLNDTKLTQNP